jgi:hypothetical protein
MLAPLLAATLLVASCMSLPQGAVPGVSLPGATNGSATLQIETEIRSGGFHTLDTVTPYAPADVARLVLSLHKADDESALLTLTVPRAELSKHVAFTKLHPDTTYRIKAAAYAEGGQHISTEDAHSWTDVTIMRDDRPTLAKLKVQLIDKTFDGQGSMTVEIATGSLIPAGSESITTVDP